MSKKAYEIEDLICEAQEILHDLEFHYESVTENFKNTEKDMRDMIKHLKNLKKARQTKKGAK